MSKGKSDLDLDIEKVDNLLFYLEKNYKWWNSKIVSDNELSVDIRKDNSLNVYYNAAKVFDITAKYNDKTKEVENIQFEITPKYLRPKIKESEKVIRKEDKKTNEISYIINDFSGKLDFSVDLNNFAQCIDDMKEEIKAHHDKPEKTLQHKYAICSGKQKKETEGIILDTEFAYKDNNIKNDFRIDMIYLHKSGKLYFVELKRQKDDRNDVKCPRDKSLAYQLEKFNNFLSEKDNCKKLIEYYSKILKLKIKHKLLENFPCKIKEIKCIENKPILLIGDVSGNFKEQYEQKLTGKIDKKTPKGETKTEEQIQKEKDFYKSIRDNCCYCVYRGKGSNYINLGDQTEYIVKR